MPANDERCPALLRDTDVVFFCRKCSYHSAATLKTMQAFVIGRTPPGPWTNSTPPIRGGIYHKQEEEEEAVVKVDAGRGSAEAEEDTSSWSGHSVGGDDDTAQSGNPPPNVRRRASAHKSFPACDAAPEDAINVQQSPSEYTDWTVQQGVNQDLRDYPSLDSDVQLSIIHKYRLLHQKIRDRGLYHCHISEYGKELARYVSLLVVSAVALRHGWYMTSAAFLGLFWVRRAHSETPDIH